MTDTPPLITDSHCHLDFPDFDGELPVLLRIGVDQVREGWLPSALQTGVSGLVLGAPRGRLINLKGELAQGRLYGPALTPIARQALENAQRWKLPVICGVARWISACSERPNSARRASFKASIFCNNVSPWAAKRFFSSS